MMYGRRSETISGAYYEANVVDLSQEGFSMRTQKPKGRSNWQRPYRHPVDVLKADRSQRFHIGPGTTKSAPGPIVGMNFHTSSDGMKDIWHLENTADYEVSGTIIFRLSKVAMDRHQCTSQVRLAEAIRRADAAFPWRNDDSVGSPRPGSADFYLSGGRVTTRQLGNYCMFHIVATHLMREPQLRPFRKYVETIAQDVRRLKPYWVSKISVIGGSRYKTKFTD